VHTPSLPVKGPHGVFSVPPILVVHEAEAWERGEGGGPRSRAQVDVAGSVRLGARGSCVGGSKSGSRVASGAREFVRVWNGLAPLRAFGWMGG
jgi:hypothetical protein